MPILDSDHMTLANQEGTNWVGTGVFNCMDHSSPLSPVSETSKLTSSLLFSLGTAGQAHFAPVTPADPVPDLAS